MIMLVTALCLSACGKDTAAYSYNVYYTNNEANKLISVEFKTDYSDTLALIHELLNQMNTKQKSSDLTIIKSDSVTIDNYGVSNHIAYIYLNQAYYDMEDSRQAIYRCGVVKTLSQIEEVDYVMFFVNNVSATYSDGTAIGMLSESDFIDDTDANANNLQWADITLYFANAKGDRLDKDTISVAYGRNVSIERVIVEQLIKGPDSTSAGRTLPVNLKLLNISIKDGICYVNLDSTFLTEIVNVSSTVPIYSIVNSLCELDNIESVQILIDGDSKKEFRESISLESPFTSNQDIISE